MIVNFFSEPSSSGYGSDSESIDDPLPKRRMVAESMEIVNVVDDVFEALEDTDQTRSVEDLVVSSLTRSVENIVNSLNRPEGDIEDVINLPSSAEDIVINIPAENPANDMSAIRNTNHELESSVELLNPVVTSDSTHYYDKGDLAKDCPLSEKENLTMILSPSHPLNVIFPYSTAAVWRRCNTTYLDSKLRYYRGRESDSCGTCLMWPGIVFHSINV